MGRKDDVELDDIVAVMPSSFRVVALIWKIVHPIHLAGSLLGISLEFLENTVSVLKWSVTDEESQPGSRKTVTRTSSKCSIGTGRSALSLGTNFFERGRTW